MVEQINILGRKTVTLPTGADYIDAFYSRLSIIMGITLTGSTGSITEIVKPQRLRQVRAEPDECILSDSEFQTLFPLMEKVCSNTLLVNKLILIILLY